MTDASSFERPTLLPFLGALRFEGPDAVAFLQGQLTNDTRLLADGRTLLAACTSAQGRVAALLRLRQQGETVYALLPAELAGPVAGRLERFVLRAKLRLSVVDDLDVFGIESVDGGSPAGVEALGAGAGDAVWFDYARDRGVLLALRRAGSDRGAPAPDDSSARETEQAWWLRDIGAGLPQVFAATAEAFVPQMLNLDLLDGISFTKGCYTGQEIVARTQHLGRIKRRTFRYRLAEGPRPRPLAGLHRDGLKVAEIVMSAQRDGVVEALAVTQLDARDVPLSLDDGRVAEPVALPYSVPT